MWQNIWQKPCGLVSEMHVEKVGLRKLVSAAVAPWDSPDSVTENNSYFGRDIWGQFVPTPGYEDGTATIEYCLHHCPYASSECTNCIENAKRKDKRKAVGR